MPINDENGNKTIARTINLDALKQRDVPPYVGANLLVNPIFEHVSVESSFPLRTAFSNTFQYAPGWYNFGHPAHGSIDAPAAAGPFHASAGSAGVLITQNAAKQHGLCQPLLRAKHLANRRVRISGCYEVQALPTGPAVGVVLYLTSFVKTLSVDADAVASTFWDNIYGTGWDALVLGNTESFKHLIRVTAKDNGYGAGEELFIRAFDSWDQVGTTTTVYMGGNPSDGDCGGVGGANASKACVDLYYLQDIETATAELGTAGFLALVDERTTDVGTKKYFEVFVDIPEEMLEVDIGNHLYGDAWVVLMPVHPDHTGTGSAEVIVWALNMEPVVEDMAGRLLFGAQVPSPVVGIGSGMGGMPARHLLRYPIYVPMLYPLHVHGITARQYRSPADATEVLENYISAHSNGSWGVHTINETFIGEQPYAPPPGSSVVKAAYQVVSTVTMHIDASSLGQVLSYDPQKYALAASGGTYPFSANEQVLVDFGNVAAGVTWSEITGFAVRNRIGSHWVQETTGPEHDFDGTADAQGDLEIVSAQAAGSLFFEVTTVDGVDNTDTVMLKNGWVLLAVDPRWQHTQWKRHP